MKKNLQKVALIALALTMFSSPIAHGADAPLTTEVSLPSITSPEIANSIAIANNGTMVASYFDRKEVEVIDGKNVRRAIDVNCNPIKVAIEDTGDWAWAICDQRSDVLVLDLKEGILSTITPDMKSPDILLHLPLKKRLVVISSLGQVIVISAKNSNDYEQLSSKFLSLSPTAAAVDESEQFLFVAEKGAIRIINLESFASEKITLQSPNIYLTEIKLSADKKYLYGAGADVTYGSENPLLFLAALKISTRTVSDQKLITSPTQGNPIISLAPSFRRLYVGSSTAITLDEGIPAGLFYAEILPGGKFGKLQSFYPDRVFIQSLAQSQDLKNLASSQTFSRLGRVQVSDTPYPVESEPVVNTTTQTTAAKPTSQVAKKISFKATLKGRSLSITGSTFGLTPGSKVSVYTRDLSKKKAKFVAQKNKVTVSTGNKISWKGSVASKKIEIFLLAGSTKSKVVLKTSS